MALGINRNTGAEPLEKQLDPLAVAENPVLCSLHTTELLYYTMNEKLRFPFLFLINRHLLFYSLNLLQPKQKMLSLYMEKWAP